MAWLREIGIRTIISVAPALLIVLAPACAASSKPIMPATHAMTSPEVVWAAPIGEIDSEPDEIDGISVDPAGNTIISGVFRNRIRFGENTYVSRGEGDIFLASYSKKGVLNWSKHIGGSGDDNTYDLTTDGAGNIIASGWFSDTVDFGGKTLTSGGSVDMYIAKYSPDGSLIWAKSFGGAAGAGGNEVAVLANGEIAVSGISEGDFSVDGQKFSYGGGGRDSFVIRMRPDGEVVWVRPVSGPGTERIRAMAINDYGTVFVGFQYRGVLEIGGKQLKSFGNWDGAVAKLNSDGEVQWLLPVGGRGVDNVRGLAAGPNGSVYVSGVIHGRTFMIDRKVPAIGKKGDDYLLRLSSDGKPQWVVSMGGNGVGTGAEMQSDQRGVIVSALIDRTVIVRRNKQKIQVIQPPTGLPTSYIAGFTPDGQPRFLYMPEPNEKGAGALGDVLSVSRDAKYLAQALRFRGGLSVGGTQMRTPSKRDSAVIFYRLDGK